MTQTATQPRPTAANPTAQPNTSAADDPSEGAGKLTLRERVESFKTQLVAFEEQYVPALPPQITPERFRGVIITAVNLEPQLLKADRRSLINACCQAAKDGLLPDKREGALVVYNTKEKGLDGVERFIAKVQWLPMVYGIIKKARQSGEIASLGARIVYEAETRPPVGPDGKALLDDNGEPLPPAFTYVIADGEERLEHRPMLWGERGQIVLSYAYCKFKDGHVEYEPLTKGDIDKIRNVSKAKNGPAWTGWFEEMAKKSAIRRLSKRLPLSAELHTTIEREDELTEFEQMRQQVRQTLIGQAASQLGAPVTGNGGNGHGEIIEGEVTETEEAGDDVLNEEAANDAEPPMERGKRLLLACKSAFDVAELAASIIEELPEDQAPAWALLCNARTKELKAKDKGK